MNVKPMWVWEPDKRLQRGWTVDMLRCRHNVWPAHSFLDTQCSRKAVTERDGYGVCKQHAGK